MFDSQKKKKENKMKKGKEKVGKHVVFHAGRAISLYLFNACKAESLCFICLDSGKLVVRICMWGCTNARLFGAFQRTG